MRFLLSNVLLFVLLSFCEAYSKKAGFHGTQSNKSVRLQELNNANIDANFTAGNNSNESPTNTAAIASVSAVLAVLASLICVACAHLARSFRRVRSDTEIPPIQSKASLGPCSTATTVKHANGVSNFQPTISSMSVACDQTLDDSTIYTSNFVSNKNITDIEQQHVSSKRNTSRTDTAITSPSHADGESLSLYLESIDNAFDDLSPQRFQDEAADDIDSSPNEQSRYDECSLDYLRGVHGLKRINVIHIDQEVEPSQLSVYSMDQFYPKGDTIDDFGENIPKNDDESYGSFSGIDIESFRRDQNRDEISKL